MYADDMVLLLQAPEGPQNVIHSLSKYTAKWNLAVNIKVAIFRNGRSV